MELVDQAINTLRDGFGQINHPQGLIIALVAALLMPSWRQWLPMALLATIVHIAVDNLPAILRGGGLPNFMVPEFWTRAGIFFLGYLIIIAVFFLLKSLVIRPSGGKAAAH
ncbi:MAG: hypothetical protein QM759_01855 [Terricaulis sp.]